MFSFFRKTKPSLGVDLVECTRFEPFRHDREHAFLKRVFFNEELSYCYSYEDPVPHLAGTFAAKEAISKAGGVHNLPFIEVLIQRRKDGKPEAFHKGKKLPFEISISHTEHYAVAIAG